MPDNRSALAGNAAEHVRRQGLQQDALAVQLVLASAHWMRHTAGSAMANGKVDLRYVRDNLGHENLSTTSIYLHADAIIGIGIPSKNTVFTGMSSPDKRPVPTLSCLSC